MINVLFLCTGNSARSIIAEVLLNALGGGRFRARSAGSTPTGSVNPGALETLEKEGHPTDGLASKSWDIFSGPAAPKFDIVITVCDSAAGETCPVWNGAPVVVHWGIPDPAAAAPEEQRQAFDHAYDQLKRRIAAFATLVIDGSAADVRAALQDVHAAACAAEARCG